MKLTISEKREIVREFFAEEELIASIAFKHSMSRESVERVLRAYANGRLKARRKR